MPYDGLTAVAVCTELNTKLQQSKVHKIYQPVKNEIMLYFSDKDKTTVTLSADAAFPRVHATGRKYANAEYPPPFCMLLRKYLIGSVLKNVTQINADRIISFSFEGLSGAGVLVKTQLIAEVMGKHSNIILIDSDSQTILDAIKHITSMQSSVREVLPKKTYVTPPNDKLAVAIAYAEEGAAALRIHAQKTLKTALVSTFSGVSNQLAQSFLAHEGIVQEACVSDFDADALCGIASGFRCYIDNTLSFGTAHVYCDQSGKAVDFSAGVYDCYSDYARRTYGSVNEAADAFYESRAVNNFIKNNYEHIIRQLEQKTARESNKLMQREKELTAAENADIYNVYGNLLLSSMHLIKRGATSAEVTDYYNDNVKITIPLREDLSPSKNAQAYFKKYGKAKNAMKHLEGLIEESKELIYYLSSQLYYLSAANDTKEAEAVIDGLKKSGVIKTKKTKAQPVRTVQKPYSFQSSDGYAVYVGKNDKQNDALTFRTAAKNDIWLHTKDIPGSHVIIKTENGQVSEAALYEAALLAAYYSKARESEKIAVDYTFASNVKKIPKSNYGKVIYTENKTLFVTPEEDKIRAITARGAHADA